MSLFELPGRKVHKKGKTIPPFLRVGVEKCCRVSRFCSPADPVGLGPTLHPLQHPIRTPYSQSLSGEQKRSVFVSAYPNQEHVLTCFRLQPWPATAGHGQKMAGHGRPCWPCLAMAAPGWSCLAMAGHGPLNFHWSAEVAYLIRPGS